ncbi:hypothetical protein T484DRAFT_2186546 [Baffinella frigidus]|nr:hypothetical protein T484DRAFT_2186546 [Cryptophyta sp. CCMP2293]
MAVSPTYTWQKKSRMRRHMALIHIPQPTLESLHTIFTTVAQICFKPLNEDLQKLAGPMARCTVKIMMELSSILVATHDRPHYVFTQHDLSKVFDSVHAHAAGCTTPVQLARLWVFELYSTFLSRLCTLDDRGICTRIIANSVDGLTEVLEVDQPHVFSFFVCQRGPGHTQPVPMQLETLDDVCEVVATLIPYSQPSINGAHPESGQKYLHTVLQLHGENLAFASMVIGRPNGNLLVMGPGGGGRRVVTGMATKLCGYVAASLSSEAGENEEQLLLEICDVYWSAGVQRTSVTLTITDSTLAQPLGDKILSLVSDILAPNTFTQTIAVFSEARKNEIYSALRPEV